MTTRLLLERVLYELVSGSLWLATLTLRTLALCVWWAERWERR